MPKLKKMLLQQRKRAKDLCYKKSEGFTRNETLTILSKMENTQGIGDFPVISRNSFSGRYYRFSCL